MASTPGPLARGPFIALLSNKVDNNLAILYGWHSDNRRKRAVAEVADSVNP